MKAETLDAGMFDLVLPLATIYLNNKYFFQILKFVAKCKLSCLQDEVGLLHGISLFWLLRIRVIHP